MSLVAVVYIGFVALAQSDMKKLVAYSSIAHMGFVTLGIFVVLVSGKIRPILKFRCRTGVEGAMVQMISHGFISGALFLMIGVLYDRMHSREIKDYGGVVNTMPCLLPLLYSLPWPMPVCLVPQDLSANSWSLSPVSKPILVCLPGATTLILGAAYTLWMVKRVFYGEVQNDNVKALTDINRRELIIMSTLAIAVLVLGLYPAPWSMLCMLPLITCYSM